MDATALFRYGLIAPLVLERTLNTGELTRRAREIAARVYTIPNSNRTSVSVDTLLDWVLRYRDGGFANWRRSYIMCDDTAVALVP